MPKTNNVIIEVWHRKMVSSVNASHPNFWSFLKVLKREQTLSNVVINQAEAGQEPTKQKAKYKNCVHRICNIVRETTITTTS